jgi:tetraacyldisaccharide 4'-kinase
MLAERLVSHWYKPRLTPLTAALVPLALVFRGVAGIRRAFYRCGVIAGERVPVPVIVIGNISVGGTGKTPLVIALARALAQRGWNPGLISRGYGAASGAVRAVTIDASADGVGDEALLLARTGFPVWIGDDRPAAARALLAAHPQCNVLLSDDGLQHYALARDVEIVVIDASRGVGNGFALPAGPLREPPSRLSEADAVVMLGGRSATFADRVFTMTLAGDRFVRVDAESLTTDAAAFRRPGVHALAGIGNPQRFFAQLEALGISATCHAFADHHRFTAADLAFAGATAILMTEKDAVKCRTFADERCWALPVRAVIEPPLVALVEEKLRGSQTARNPCVSGHQGTVDP